MSHTIVRETSNEAGEKILRAKSLNSGVGILNDHTLNSMRKSFFFFFFVTSFRPVGGREQNAGRRKDWVSDWDGLWQCQLWSGQPAQMMSEYMGSWKKKGRRAEPEHKTRAGGGCQVDKDIVKRVKFCVGQPLCSLLVSGALGDTFFLDLVGQQCSPARVQSRYPDFAFDPLALLLHAAWPLGLLYNLAPLTICLPFSVPGLHWKKKKLQS